MSCDQYEERLIDWALGAPVDAETAAHVETCAACRIRLDQERRLAAVVDETLASSFDVAPRPGFEARVRRSVEKKRTHLQWWRRAGIGVGIAATVALVAAVSMRPTNRTVAPVVAENARPPQATAIPDTPSLPAVRHEPVSPVVAPRRVASRAAPKRPAEPEVIVAPGQAAALRRHLERLGRDGAPEVVVANEPPLTFAPASLEVGTLDDLPRLSTSDVPRIEPPRPVNRLVTGGDV